MKITFFCIVLMAGMFLMSVAAFAEVSAASDDASLDTRMLSSILEMEDQDLDTRTHTTDLSVFVPLNTRKIIGTLLILK